MKNYFSSTIALICIGMMWAGTTNADTLVGTYFSADDTNTSVVATGGTPASGGWATSASTIGGDAGYNHSLVPDVLVTTVSNLTPGDEYDVAIVYSNLSFFATNIAAGLTPTSLIDAPIDNDNVVDGALTDITVSTGDAYDFNFGRQTVDANGDLNVFVDDSAGNNQSSFFFGYHGITFQLVEAVPEPNSMALIGLIGGVGLIRRRR